MTRALLFSTAICLAWSGSAMAQEGRFVVLFPFDKSTINAEAQATINSAAEEFKRTGVVPDLGPRQHGYLRCLRL